MSIIDYFLIQPVFQLFTLLITALSSWYLIREVIELTPKEAAHISATHRNFAEQKANMVLGFILMMASLFIQALSISQPLRWIDVDGLTVVHIIVTSILFIFIIYASEVCKKKLVHKYTQMLD